MKRKFTDISILYHAVIVKIIEILDNGEIWRIGKRVTTDQKGVFRINPCKRVRAEQDSIDYLQFSMSINNRRRYVGAHRLVYYHFYGEIPKGMTVNHKNGNKKDNHPLNLELMTDSEQQVHRLRILKTGLIRKEKMFTPRLKEQQVHLIHKLAIEGKNNKEIAKIVVTSQANVSLIVNGKNWRKVYAEYKDKYLA